MTPTTSSTRPAPAHRRRHRRNVAAGVVAFAFSTTLVAAVILAAVLGGQPSPGWDHAGTAPPDARSGDPCSAPPPEGVDPQLHWEVCRFMDFAQQIDDLAREHDGPASRDGEVAR